jgi:peptidylprolyl isomerase
MFGPKPGLDGQYTIWGQVDDEGMFCVDRIERGEPPENPDKMMKATVQ